MSADHGRLPLECIVLGIPCASVKEGSAVLSRLLGRPVSYWRLYRALRKGRTEVEGVLVSYPPSYTPVPRLDVREAGSLLIRPHAESGLGVYRG
jgi:hypothetical protein